MELGVDLGGAWEWGGHAQNTIYEILKLAKYIKTTTKYNNAIVSAPGKLPGQYVFQICVCSERELRLCIREVHGKRWRHMKR